MTIGIVLIVLLLMVAAYAAGRADEVHWQRYIRGEVPHRKTGHYVDSSLPYHLKGGARHGSQSRNGK